MSKNNKAFPVPMLPGYGAVAEVKNIVNIQLLGGMNFGSIYITTDQLRELRNCFPVEDENTDDKTLDGSRNNLHLLRQVEHHGLRIMAFLAGRRLLEANRDPVLSLADMLYDFLEEEVVDISQEEEEQ